MTFSSTKFALFFSFLIVVVILTQLKSYGEKTTKIQQKKNFKPSKYVRYTYQSLIFTKNENDTKEHGDSEYCHVHDQNVTDACEYVQENDVSKSKPLGKRSSIIAPILSIIIGIACFLFHIELAIILVPFFIIVYVLFTKYIKYKVGGYTGDILGALQQISEIGFYLMFLIYQQVWL